MAKKSDRPGSRNGRDRTPDAPPEAEYYKLKLQAVDDLVNATPENSPEVSREELRKYHAQPKLRLADWLKAILIKFWLAGVICYFFIWGLSTFALNQLDHLLVLSLSLGAITHLITNNILRFIAPAKGRYDRWMMFPRQSLWYLPLDVLYAAILIFLTVMTYNGINLLFRGAEGTAALGVEPLGFGLIVTAWDLLFLGARQLFRRILQDAKRQAAR